jgi:hypothetical protein
MISRLFAMLAFNKEPGSDDSAGPDAPRYPHPQSFLASFFKELSMRHADSPQLKCRRSS